MGALCSTGKVLIVATSSADMNGHATGAWSEEITGPYYTFKDAGYYVVVCSIAGGDVPIDQGSLSDNFKTENDKRMETEDPDLLKNTFSLATQDASFYDIVFFAGGHGTCQDFPTASVGSAIAETLEANKVVAAVCHGPMALVNAKTKDGVPIVKGKKIACFTNEEEEQVGLSQKVPFSLADKMKALGASVTSGEPWSDTAVSDGKLVTGQNPQSSVSCAKLAISASK